jgi:Family of unknown function (DUF6580)
MAWVYGASAVIALIGTSLRRRPGPLATVAATLGSGFLFYAVTNFGVWAAGDLYPRTAAGFAACYIAALPFYGNQIAGDLIFSGALFGLYRVGTTVYARYRPQTTE